MIKQFQGINNLGNKNANFTYSLAAGYKLIGIDFTKISGTPVVKVGETLGGEEIKPGTTIVGIDLNPIRLKYASTKTIYFTISGGTVEVELQIIPN